MALDAKMSSPARVFAIASIGLSLSLTIFVVSTVNCSVARVCGTLDSVLLAYSLLSLPIAVLLLVDILVEKPVAIRVWKGVTIFQFIVEIAVSGYLVYTFGGEPLVVTVVSPGVDGTCQALAVSLLS